MQLKSFQATFVKQLSDNKSRNAFLSHLKPCGKLLAEQQLAIYINNNQSALQKALAHIYPVCLNIVGENYFKQIARSYISDYPSKHYDLNSYGKFFSIFLKSQAILHHELKDYPYLADLALLEWFYHQIYYVPQRPVFDFSAFAGLSQDQYAGVSFKLSPDIKFLDSDYPVVSIWQGG